METYFHHGKPREKGEEQRSFVQKIVSSRSYIAVPGSFWGWWNTNPVIDGQRCRVDTANHADYRQADISRALESGCCAGFKMEQRL
jgi:hypothetical protein